MLYSLTWDPVCPGERHRYLPGPCSPLLQPVCWDWEVSVSTIAAGGGAQPCSQWQSCLLPSSGLTVVAPQSPWKGLSCVPCPSACVWRQAWCSELGHLRGAVSNLPACAPLSLQLGGSLSHHSSKGETGSVWPGMFALCCQVASPTAHEQMVPSAMFALGSVSSGGSGEEQLYAPSHALAAKPGQSA